MMSGRGFLTDVEVPYASRVVIILIDIVVSYPTSIFLTDVVYYVSIYYVGLETDVEFLFSTSGDFTSK